MSFTRFHDDESRIIKTNMETTAMNDYVFNVPGNSNAPSIYYEDPHLTMQKTGVPLYHNMVSVENQLKGLNMPVSRDRHTHQEFMPLYQLKSTVENHDEEVSDETRTSHPVFQYRELGTYQQSFLFHDPQKNVEIPFRNNLDTNILEKDHYNLNRR